MSEKNVSRETTELGATIQMNRTDVESMWKTVKEAFGTEPKDVNAQFVLATDYYRRYLLSIIKGRIKIKCPDWWSKDYMLNMLILKGRFFITDSVYGVAPYDGATHGLNIFNRPPRLTLTNHLLEGREKNLERVLYGDDANAVAVYLYDDHYYRSMSTVLDIYAQKLANCDGSFDVSLINTRLPYIFNCSDSKQAKEAKKVYDDISAGKPAVFTRVHSALDSDGGGIEVSTLPVKDNFVADRIVELKRYIISEFLTVIGLNSNTIEKKERLITAEVDSNNEETMYSVRYIKSNLKRCTKAVNKMFPDLGFSIKLRKSENEKKVEKTEKNGDESADNQKDS